MCDLSPVELTWSKVTKLCSREQRGRRSVTEAAARLDNRRDCNVTGKVTANMCNNWNNNTGNGTGLLLT
jgi:hypothetical protein